MRTTKAQISLRIRTVWPAPFLFAAWIVQSFKAELYLWITYVASFSIPFLLRNKDFSCFIVLISHLLSRILGEGRSPSITGTNNPITIHHLSIIILNYPLLPIINNNYQLQVIWLWTKVSGNCLQICRGTVSKSRVGELSCRGTVLLRLYDCVDFLFYLVWSYKSWAKTKYPEKYHLAFCCLLVPPGRDWGPQWWET